MAYIYSHNKIQQNTKQKPKQTDKKHTTKNSLALIKSDCSICLYCQCIVFYMYISDNDCHCMIIASVQLDIFFIDKALLKQLHNLIYWVNFIYCTENAIGY